MRSMKQKINQGRDNERTEWHKLEMVEPGNKLRIKTIYLQNE